MSLIPLGIVLSFVALVASFLAYAAQLIWQRQPWQKIYRGAGVVAILLYGLSAAALYADGQPWSLFKTEVTELLALYVVAAASFLYSWKRTAPALSHSVVLVLLLLIALVMHLKWSGLF